MPIKTAKHHQEDPEDKPQVISEEELDLEPDNKSDESSEPSLDSEKENPEETIQRPEMKINFDYSNKQSSQLGDEQTNTEMVENQVSTLDDLLEKTEKQENDQQNDQYMADRNKETDREDVPSDAELGSNESDEQIPQIKHPRLSRTIGEDEDAPQYQQSHFPHDNFGQNPIYANRDAGQKAKKGGNKFYLFLLLLLGVLIIGGVVLVLKHKIALPLANNTPSPTPEATIAEQTPSPSPSPTPIDRSKYKITVLNGTGKTGLAASVSAQLKSLGYQIDKTGNASSTNQTTIKVKKGDNDLMNQLITDLSPNYTATGSATLPANDSADGEVILGLK